MKKLTHLLTLSFLATLAFGFTFMSAPQSAEAGWWTWRTYRLKFWLPNGMRVTRNNRYTFIAKGKGIVLKINPWKSFRGTSVSAARYGLRTYSIIKGKRVLSRKRISSKGRAFRYLIVGSGWVGRTPAYFAVIGMSSKVSRTKFYVRFWWPKWRHRWVTPRIGRIARSIYVY